MTSRKATSETSGSEKSTSETSVSETSISETTPEPSTALAVIPSEPAAPVTDLTFGVRLTLARRTRSLTQAVLGERAGTSGDIVGKYERGEMRPSIEVAARLADALSVSLDYLAGLAETTADADPETTRRLREIAALSADGRERVFMVIDALLRDFQARAIYNRATPDRD